MRNVPDLERALSRLALDRGGPRDLAAVRGALAAAREIADNSGDGWPHDVAEALGTLSGQDALLARLETALVDEPPHLARDGGFIAPGVDDALDDARRLRDESRGVIAGLQADYAKISGIASLKIRHNNVLGYFIEVTATHAGKMLSPPLSETFVHRQTTASAVRFTTKDLTELETRILSAADEALSLEISLYSALKVQSSGLPVSRCSLSLNGLAELDLFTALALLAGSGGWCRPLVDGQPRLRGGGGSPSGGRSRHWIAMGERLHRKRLRAVRNGGPTVPTSGLDRPNMAGKSTFLRPETR